MMAKRGTFDGQGPLSIRDMNYTLPLFGRTLRSLGLAASSLLLVSLCSELSHACDAHENDVDRHGEPAEGRLAAFDADQTYVLELLATTGPMGEGEVSSYVLSRSPVQQSGVTEEPQQGVRRRIVRVPLAESEDEDGDRAESSSQPVRRAPERTLEVVGMTPPRAVDLGPETVSSAATPSDARSNSRRRGEVWECPVESPRITSPFGPRIHPVTGEVGRMHRGTDYGAATGTPIFATASGRVEVAGWCSGGRGNCIIIDHGDGWKSHYFHLNRVRVRQGEEVGSLDRIGDIGTTGRSTGPHLHFQIESAGEMLDPERLLGRRAP